MQDARQLRFDMTQDIVRRHFIDQLAAAELKTEPYEHFYLDAAFPGWYFEQILRHLPEDALYTDRTYENRMMADLPHLGSRFWADADLWLTSCMWAVLDKFDRTITKRGLSHFRAQTRLVRDKEGYAIMPHTDVKAKAASLLFYLPKDESMLDAGTSIMVPREAGMTSDGSKRYPLEQFEIVYTAAFKPNGVLGFPRSDVSFHGVRPIKAQVRDVLLLNVYGS